MSFHSLFKPKLVFNTVVNGGYHCTKCEKHTKFFPSLTARNMTTKQAKSIFIDAKKGMCSECYVESRNKGSV